MKQKSLKPVSRLLITLILVSIGAHATFPMPTFLRPGTGGVMFTSPGPMSAKTWQKIYCERGFNQDCFNHLVFKTAASQRAGDRGDTGLRLAIAAVNNAVFTQLTHQREEISQADQRKIQLALNEIRRQHEEMRLKALGEGLAWNDDQSVKSVMAIVKALPLKYAEVTGTLFEGVANYVDQFYIPYKQLTAQGNYAAAYEQINSLGDVFGDLQINSRNIKGLSAAVDPFLAAYLGVTTQETAEQIFAKNPLLENLFISQENRELLKKIYAELKLQSPLTEESMREIMTDFQQQSEQASASLQEIAAAPSASPPAVLQQNLARLKTFEESVTLMSNFAALLPAGKMQDLVNGSSVIGGAVATCYRSFLNPEGLSLILRSANIVGAATAVIRLFSNQGPSLDSQILNEVRELRKDVYSLHEDIAHGFEATIDRIDHVYQSMLDGFDAILSDQNDQMMKLQDLEMKLDELQKRLVFFESSEKAFHADLAEEFKDLANVACFDQAYYFRRKALSMDQFQTCGARILVDASRVSKNSITSDLGINEVNDIRANPEPYVSGQIAGLRDLSLANMSTELSGLDPLTRMNVLGVGFLLHGGLDFFPQAGSEKTSVPSLHNWILSANAFLELLNQNPQHRATVKRESFDSLEETGVEIQSFIRNLRASLSNKRFLGLIEKSQENFSESLRAMENNFLADWKLEDFASKFWTQVPAGTTFSPASPTTIAAADFGTAADLPVHYPMEALPAAARLAVQLGIQQLRVENVAMSSGADKNNHWLNERYRETSRSYASRGHGRRMGDNLDADRPFKAEGKVVADLEIQSRFFVGDQIALICSFKNSAGLWIGNFQSSGINHERGAIIQRHVRPFADVLNQVWTDSNNVGGHGVCSIPSSFDSAPIQAANRAEWIRRRALVRQSFQNAMNAKATTAVAEASRIAVRRAAELYSSYEMVRNALQLALGADPAKTTNLVESFYSGILSLYPSQAAGLLENVDLDADGDVVEGLKSQFSARNEQLRKAIEDELSRQGETSGTIPEVDLMIERIRARR